MSDLHGMGDGSDVVSHQHPLHHLYSRPARAIDLGAMPVGIVHPFEGACLYRGVVAEETTGAANARMIIGDGDAQAVVVSFGPYTYAANESRADIWPDYGVTCLRGLTVQVTLGNVRASVFYTPITRSELRYLRSIYNGAEQ